MRTGRPVKNFDKKLFMDLVGLGCEQDEICWMFRDENGKAANPDTLSRWCKREFGMNFQEFAKKNRAMMLKVKLRKNQLKLSEKSAAMSIWLGKQYLGQRDNFDDVNDNVISALENVLVQIRKNTSNGKKEETGSDESNRAD